MYFRTNLSHANGLARAKSLAENEGSVIKSELTHWHGSYRKFWVTRLGVGCDKKTYVLALAKNNVCSTIKGELRL